MRTFAAAMFLSSRRLLHLEEAAAPHVLEPVGLDHLDRAEVLLDPRRQAAELGLDLARRPVDPLRQRLTDDDRSAGTG